MRKIIFMALAAVLLAGCGGGKTTSPLTKEVLVDAVGTMLAGDSGWTVEDLVQELRAENKFHYAFGCMYPSQEAAEAADIPGSPDRIIDWVWGDHKPPLPSGYPNWNTGSDFGIGLTFFDPDSAPTNAEDFTETVVGAFTCYFPSGTEAAMPTPEKDCIYTLHYDLTGETKMLDGFPPNVYPAADMEYGNGGLAIALADPRDDNADITLIVPACKRNEALAIIEARQAADKEQAKQGIPFEQRTYP